MLSVSWKLVMTLKKYGIYNNIKKKVKKKVFFRF